MSVRFRAFLLVALVFGAAAPSRAPPTRTPLHDTVLTREAEAATARVVMSAVVKVLGQWHDATGDEFLDTAIRDGPATAASIAIPADAASREWGRLRKFVDWGDGDSAVASSRKVTRHLLAAIAVSVRALEVHLDHNTGFDSDPLKPGHVGPAEMLQMLEAALKEEK